MPRGHSLLWFLLTLVGAGLLIVLGLRLLGGHTQPVTIEPRMHDFGRVMQGEIPVKTFTVTNHSDRVVSLMPQPNCSCFAVERGKSLQPLDPGASMDVKVIFDTTTKPPGPVKGKWITFNTDHPQQRGIVVPLEGEIFRAYELRPAMLNYGRIDGRPRNFEPRVVRLRPANGYAVRLVRTVSMPDVFDVATTPGEPDGADITLTLRRDQQRRVGAFRAAVRLELELTAPGGQVLQERPVVKVQGFWSIKRQ